MKLGVQVDLGSGHIMLDRDSAPLQRDTAPPTVRPMSVVAKRLDRSRCHLVGGGVNLGPRDIVLDGDQV